MEDIQILFEFEIGGNEELFMYSGNELWPHDMVENMIEIHGVKIYPEPSETLFYSFMKTCDRYPTKVAVIDDDGCEYSYEILRSLVLKCSLMLQSTYRVEYGDMVGIMLFNSIDFCVYFLALNRLGAIAVPLPTKYREEEIHSLLTKVNLKMIVTAPDYQSYFSKLHIEMLVSDGIENIANLPYDEVEKRHSLDTLGKSSDAAILMFTSGTTSLSKGVVISNRNIMHAIVSYKKTLNITSNDIAILPIPMYLVTGLIAIFGLMMFVGGTVCLNKYFSAERVMKDVQKNAITFIHSSPTVFTLLLENKSEKYSMDSIRIMACGSGNMPPAKIKALHEWMPKAQFRTVYGLTETTSPCTVFPCDAYGNPHIGSSGIPIPGELIQILDDSGNELPDGKQGIIWVKGANVTERYYHLKTDMIHDGWLNTGDIGYFDRAGYLFIVDRKKDMINRGGEKICSYDVENEMMELEGVRDAAVVGIADELYGEVPVAVVVMKEGYSFNESYMRSALKARIAGYKVPVRILELNRMPVTENMKTDKRYIKTLF